MFAAEKNVFPAGMVFPIPPLTNVVVEVTVFSHWRNNLVAIVGIKRVYLRGVAFFIDVARNVHLMLLSCRSDAVVSILQLPMHGLQTEGRVVLFEPR